MTDKSFPLEPKPVEVWDGTGTGYLGKGMLVDHVQVQVWRAPDGGILSLSDGTDPLTEEQEDAIITRGYTPETIDFNPKIVMDDDGRIFYGCQVYWKFIHETE